MNEYKNIPIRELATVTSSKRIFLSDYVNNGIPFYRSKEIIEKSLNQKVSTELFISKQRYEDIKIKFGSPRDGDILIAAVGERAGIPYLVNNDGDFYFKDGNLIWIKDFKPSLSPKYLLHYLKSNIGQSQLESTMIGSAQKALTIIGIKNLEISLPPLFEQESIAEVLSSLNDKIVLLHNNNKNIEQLAETLFKHWFDINNEDVSKHGYLGDYFKDTIGGEWGKDKEDIDHNIEVKCIRGTDIGNLYNGIPKPPIRYIKESKYEKCKLLDGDIIIEISGGTEDQSTGRCHYFNNNLIELLGGKVVFSNFCRLLRPKLNDYTYFLHVYINLIYQRGDFFNLENGTSGIKNLDLKSFLYQEKFFLPKDMDIIRFNKIVTPFFNKLTKNLNQIQQLETLRDTLLPKLMSGLVRVEN